MIGVSVFVHSISTLGLIAMSAFTLCAKANGKELYDQVMAFNSVAEQFRWVVSPGNLDAGNDFINQISIINYNYNYN